MSDATGPMASDRGDSASHASSMAIRFLGLLLTLFVFILSINLMSTALGELTESAVGGVLRHATANPLIGLLLGILATSIIQSSSTTTTVVVSLAAAGTIDLSAAIPMVMGANIGTTVTNTIVSFTHVRRGDEFRRALAAGTVHDFFNILAVAILFPLELKLHILEKAAVWVKGTVIGQSFGKVSGLKIVIKPIVSACTEFFHYPGVSLAVALIVLFAALTMMVKLMRSLFISKMARVLDRFLFRNALSAFVVGIVFTMFVQSSSVTTSLVVPLVGAGILTIRQVFPYTLGANVGTTVTAFLGALVIASTLGTEKAQLGVTVAVVHLLFNVFGIALIYPVKFIPIWLAESLSRVISGSMKRIVLFIVLYFALYIIPIVIFFLF